MNMTGLFAEVAILGTALDKCLHYAVPAEAAAHIEAGSRVSVPVGKRKAAGIVISLANTAPELPEGVTIRPIVELLDPAIPRDLLDLCRWISSYYFYPIGEVLSLALPLGGSEKAGAILRGRKIKVVRFTERARPGLPLPAKAAEIISALERCGGSMPLKDLKQAVKNPERRLANLVRDGLAVIEEKELEIPAREEVHEPPASYCVELTADQKAALDVLMPQIQQSKFRPSVLYGVTGSGKTEIYVRLVEDALSHDGGALVLVPEIALSTQLEGVFGRRFGKDLAVWHSALSERERRSQWADILAGKRKVVLGARSAVLSPVRNLRLIIVDEEQDSSYKQEDRLRYNARDVAVMRGKIVGVPVVLGSATPSLQTVYHCRLGHYGTVSLPTRVLNRPHPVFEIADMRREGSRSGIFSVKLREAIAETLQKGRQVLLFLNRRGYAKYFLCNTCGHALQCISCSLTLTYHKNENCLRCHYCGWETPLPERCPKCGHAALFAHGFGTERVEKEAGKLFPNARLVRVDRDTMVSHEKLLDALDAVRSGRADILLGTQMVAKGHDFPDITLVGVINADAGLQVPDFRAGEGLVQMLIQVAGRAGRGSEPGRVILQTYNPFHFTIDSALKLDYDGFCEKELESRKILQYPPFTRLLKLLVTSAREDAAQSGARLLASICRETAASARESGRHIAVMGPSAAAYVKLKNRFRWHVFVKTWNSADMQSFTQTVLDSIRNDAGFRDVQVTVDRDPANDI